ncbi:MAG: hypothetical protein Q9M91_05765 [Candidatus Dojkabacteria bacterium]|nr:hypothetical protein [Candidatus Dojkabacteria bacterium]
MRIQSIIGVLKKLKLNSESIVDQDKYHDKKNRTNSFLYALSSIFYLIGTILFYLQSGDLRVIIIGLIGFLIILFLLIILKVSLATNKTRNFRVDPTDLDSSYNSFTTHFDPNEDALLVNSSWVKALRSESFRLNEMLKRNLGGKDYNEVQLELGNIEKSIDEIKNEIDELEKNRITSEEYLKKRRELDVLSLKLKDFKKNLKTSSSENSFSHIPIILYSYTKENLGNNSLLENLEKDFQIIKMV